MRGTSDADVAFLGLCRLLKRLGFKERIRGDQHIFTKEGIEEILNLQPKGSKSKPYQVNPIVASYCDTNFRWGMRMSKYEIIIYWSREDEAFIAEVPELPGCMADGETYNEALSNAEKIIEEWIETAIELERPIPEARGRLMFA